ncbi:dockerin type I domain-containing protein [Roseivirga sp.]|uniref:dockerin type I domain-containing protein n=1 Tax=Roseivirga sp. TaxID=1964215 RepID=UPI003B8BC971
MIRNKKWIIGCTLTLISTLNLYCQTDQDNSSSSEGVMRNNGIVAFPADALNISSRVTTNSLLELLESKKEIVTTTLSVGDIAIIKMTHDDPDDYTFITFVDILAGTKIYFTDCGVTSSGSFGSNPSFFPNDASACSEGADLYTVPAGGLSAGDIVTWSTSSDFVDYTDSGMRRSGGGTNLSTSGDQILVFQDGDGTGGQEPGRNPSYIFIAHTSSTQFAGNGADGTTQSHLPTGLSASTSPRTAVALGAGSGASDEWDNVVYSGSYDFSSAGNQAAAIAAAKIAMTNPSNFIKTNDRNASNYTTAVAAIPANLTTVSSDTDPPSFDATPTSSSITQTGFTLGTDINEAGTIYYVVVANGATAPTSANVKAGQSSGGGSVVTSGNAVVNSGGFTNNFGVTGLSAGTAYDVYVVAQDDESSPNIQASPTKVDVTTLAPASIQVAATVFLEGAWNGTNAMNTTLEDANLVSASAPYNGTNSHAGSESVASAAAVPDGAVDWVLVELREAGSAAGAVNSTRKGSAAGFLMSNGSIKAIDGTSNLSINLSGNTGTDYYVVIYHRNHLPIMSANAIVGSSGTLTIDFTANSANTYQTTTALVALSGSKFGMPSGDLNQDGNINGTDLGTWQTNNGITFSYGSNGAADFNLDGEINAVDRNDFHQKNTSKTRQVPTSI